MTSFIFSERNSIPEFYTDSDNQTVNDISSVCAGDDQHDMLPYWTAYICGGACFVLFSVLACRLRSRPKTFFIWNDVLYWFFLNLFTPFIYMGGFQHHFTVCYSCTFIFGIFSIVFDPNIIRGHNLWGHRFIMPGGPRKCTPQFEKGKNEKALIVHDVFQGAPFPITTMVFLLQCILFLFYASSVWENGRPCFDKHRQYIFYIVANIVKALYFTIEMQIESKAGKYFDSYQFWMQTRHAVVEDGWKVKIQYKRKPFIPTEYYGEDTERAKKRELAGITFAEKLEDETKMEKCEWHMRRLMSLFVNGYIRWTLFILITIQLAQSPHSLEFVLNFVAALFIIKIDDYSYWGVFCKVTIEKPETTDLESPRSPDEFEDHPESKDQYYY